MCEFCMKHGEGKRWYLQAKNYSDDLLSDARRRKVVEELFSNPQRIARSVARLDGLSKAPRFVQGVVRRLVTRRMKRDHFGQVVPIEEVEGRGRRAVVLRLRDLPRRVREGCDPPEGPRQQPRRGEAVVGANGVRMRTSLAPPEEDKTA